MLSTVMLAALLLPTGSEPTNTSDSPLPRLEVAHGMVIAPMIQGFSLPSSAALLGIEEHFGTLFETSCTNCEFQWYVTTDITADWKGGSAPSGFGPTWHRGSEPDDFDGELEYDPYPPGNPFPVQTYFEITGVTTTQHEPECTYSDVMGKCSQTGPQNVCTGSVEIDIDIPAMWYAGEELEIAEGGSSVSEMKVTLTTESGALSCGEEMDTVTFSLKVRKRTGSGPSDFAWTNLGDFYIVTQCMQCVEGTSEPIED